MNPLYEHTEAVHNLTAPRQVVPLILSLINVSSVVDVGCGTGTWLTVFQEHGIKDYLGVDGDNVELSMLTIPKERFITHDLRQPLSLARKFDLVVALEVAEHLPEDSADQFVRTLVTHGDTILFSAAIPGQGGQNHCNEQWPEYWQEKFKKHGFYFHDDLRPMIWNNADVQWWYKQNIFLVKRTQPASLPFNSLSVVHPELFTLHKNNQEQFYASLVAGRQGLKLAVRVFFNAIVFKIKNLFNRS